MIFLIFQLCHFCLLLQQRACLCFLYSPVHSHPHIRCSKSLISSDHWLDLLQCVLACSVREPRTRHSTPGVSHCAEQITSSDLLAALCLVQLRRLLTTFATGLQCWLMFSLPTRALRFLFEKLLSS